LQVGHLAGFGVLDGGGGGEGLDFGEETGVNAGIGEDVEESATEGCRGRVGSGEAGWESTCQFRGVPPWEADLVLHVHLNQGFRLGFCLGEAVSDE
jgi:hypothetical protein